MNKKMREYGSLGSPIRARWARAVEEKKVLGEDRVFDFTLGNPSAPTPKEVDDALIGVIKDSEHNGAHSYTPSNGLEIARKAVADHLRKTYGADINPKRVFMTVGALAGLAIGLTSLLEEGDEVLAFAPHYSEYGPLIEKAGGFLATVMTNEKFLPDEKLFEKAVNEKTKVVIINSPNNPTGAFYDEGVIKMLASVLRRKSEEYGRPIYLFSDEPYRELLYVDEKYPFPTNYYEYVVVAYSFSKSLSLPGERLGYLLTGENNPEKEDLLKAFLGSSRSLGYVCATSLFQKILPEVVGLTSDIDIYRKNRETLMNGLKEIGYEYIVPQGAFYLFMKSLEEDDVAFAEKAAKLHIYVVPSSAFAVKGYVRIAYCVDRNTIVNSLPAFKELFDSYRR